MTDKPTRRLVLKGAALGALAVPLRVFTAEAAAAPAADGIFGYGVASGDPTGDAVIIWTRATPPPAGGRIATPGSGLGRPVCVHWEVARDSDFRHMVKRGTVYTNASTDHTVKVDVTGLQPYTRYFYRFHAEGETSPVGRTQTAPDEAGHLHALRFGLVSCSNYTGGYFSAYRALGQRDDLDFVLHLGDYLYEYGNGADRSGPPELIGVRDHIPPTEILTLTDYRLRHALHKADPDAALAHRRHPWITIFDDHEVADNAWDSGAGNHTDATEGSFAARRRDAYRAYLEWMPFRLPEQRVVPHQGTRFFRKFTFGPLGDLSVIETRQNRSAQVNLPPFSTSGGGLIPLGVNPAADAQLADPARHLLEPEQLTWLKNNTADARPWHLIGNQVVLGPLRFPGAAVGVPPELTLINSDQWDGYQADQSALLTHLAAQASDTVVLTGDIHSSWAIDLPNSAGVEFVTPSVTSDGFYEIVRGRLPAGTPPEALVTATRVLEGALRAANPNVKFLDGVGHGYTLIDVTPERVQADYHHTPLPTSAMPNPVAVQTTTTAYLRSWQTLAGSRKVTAATGPVGARSDNPA
ncbi:phosphodiesterase/alkaline phosphatase D-like protein [Kibdelosporangium banguiense]|uniref:Phosphodiesterase/alkaline phosphatase D-like protein n=1 Tax=Kibdelosporangium banguiense TaxID=1365924 RepID=A0ABS4TTC8_9PSEU|nr:alkaline phosphatase D family protein [Kibdelosporangium banguiense]MBP2327644.1 phosphodiesterase/alkaline phosphatase D-like protein [Kibdelosporangium banguiense]